MVRRVGAAVLVGLMLLSGAVGTSLVYACPMAEGLVQKRCCCPPAETETETPTIATGCCQAVERAPVAASPSESTRILQAPDAAPAVTAIAAVPVVTPTPARAEAVDHASTGPPILQKKQSFLI